MQRSRIRTPYESSKRLRGHGAHRGKNWPYRILQLAVTILLAWVIASPFGLYRLHRLIQERRHLGQENKAISLRIRSLRRQVQALKGDRQLQERLVREELGWVRDNEIIYIFHGR